jgi:hypothetical protein
MVEAVNRLHRSGPLATTVRMEADILRQHRRELTHVAAA